MKYLDDMVIKGLAEVSTADRQALALTGLIQLAQYRDRCYRFFLAMAGTRYPLGWECLAGHFKN